jgi:hypothetical protein
MITDIQVKAILENEIDDAIGYLESDTTDERTKALNYYLRNPLGNEIEGRSQIVTGEVAEAVDGALPQLIRIFTSADDVVQFEPKSPGDEPFAKQATEYANWVFYRQNDGFLILHNWFKDALLQKTGIVKAYWNDETDVIKEKYKDLTDDELVLLLSDDSVEVVEQDTEEVIDPMGMIYRKHSVKIQKKVGEGKIVIENVPPEEFLMSKNGRTVQDSPFCAHRRMMTRSELVAMGFPQDVVDSLPSGDRLQYSQERLARYDRSEQPDDTQSIDYTMQEVEVYECYIRIDEDDDGIAELRRIVYAGNEILEDEECDYIPFHSICPIPIPHKFYGQSLADRTIDLQLIKTTITRQMLDNLYLTNNARVTVVDGQANLDDLLTSTPGGVIRVKNPQAVNQLAVQNVAGQAFPMLEYLDNVQAKRTGVSDAQQGLNPDVLNNVTAAAVSAMMTAAAGKIELMARIFAETGVKSLMKGILHLLCKYQDKPKVVRLRGQYVPFDPRQWSNQYDVSINVGLGTGSRQEQIAMLQMIMQKQETILQGYGPANPLVSVGQYRETLGRLIEAAGFKDTDTFFKPIPPEMDAQLSQPQQQQQQPDPAILLAQVEQQKAQLRAQSDAARLQADIQVETAKLQAEREQAIADIAIQQAKLEIEREKNAIKLQLEQAKILSDNAVAQREMALSERQQLINELEMAQERMDKQSEAAGILNSVLMQLRG